MAPITGGTLASTLSALLKAKAIKPSALRSDFLKPQSARSGYLKTSLMATVSWRLNFERKSNCIVEAVLIGRIGFKTSRAVELLLDKNISRLIADPDPCPPPDPEILHVQQLVNYRLHGSPEKYRSKYSDVFVTELSEQVWDERGDEKEIWCVFDHTAQGYATENALTVQRTIFDYDAIL